LKILHVGNTANIAYYLSYYLTKNFNVKSDILQTKNPRNEFAYKMIYGYESGNPLNQEIKWYHSDYFKRIKDFKIIKDEKYDILHIHTGGSLINTMLCKFSGKKTIIHYHGSDLRENNYKNNIVKSLNKIIKYDYTFISTPDLAKYINDVNFMYLPNPLDPNLLINNTINEEKYIFFPTRHDEKTKKTSIAFEAWNILKKYDKDITLRTIKWGSNWEYLKEINKNEPRVIWMDPLNRSDYIKTLMNASIIWGQFELGIMSLIELETLYINKPLITYINNELYNDLSDYSNLKAKSTKEIFEETLNIIKNIDRYDGRYLNYWVNKHHNSREISKNIYDVYKKIVEK
jgi:Glycosyl transferase 4-like